MPPVLTGIAAGTTTAGDMVAGAAATAGASCRTVPGSTPAAGGGQDRCTICATSGLQPSWRFSSMVSNFGPGERLSNLRVTSASSSASLSLLRAVATVGAISPMPRGGKRDPTLSDLLPKMSLALLNRSIGESALTIGAPLPNCATFLCNDCTSKHTASCRSSNFFLSVFSLSRSSRKVAS